MPSALPTSLKAWRRDPTQISSGFARVANYEFDVLEEHRKFAAASLAHAEKSLDDRIAAGANELPTAERGEYYDRYYDNYVEISEDFPRIQWYSQFLLVYSTFEHLLQRLCLIVQRRSNLTLTFKDLDGQGIVRARNYLAKVTHVTKPFETAAWHRALLLADIRNAIAHRNGEIPVEPGNPKSLYVRLAKVRNLTLKTYVADQPDVDILLSPEFVHSAIADLREVISDIAHYPLYPNEA